MILKIFDLKKGNKDRVVSELLDSSLVEKVHKQVKIKRNAARTGISYPMHTTEIPISTSGSK